jgi:O-antigen/teichoic acid export membrane protein
MIIFSKFIKDHRNLSIFKNSFGIGLLKLVSLVVSFLTVRLFLKILGAESYGFWLTLSSVVSWITLVDFGLGNGLQNRLSVLLANNNIQEAKTEIGTTFVTLSMILGSVLLFFIPINYIIDWNIIFNSTLENKLIKFIIFITITSVVLQLILKLSLAVLFAYQKTVLMDLVYSTTTLTVYLLIYLAFKLEVYGDNLITIAVISGVLPIIILCIASYAIFFVFYKKLLPNKTHIQFSKSKKILNLGFKFLVFQLFGLVMYATDNVLISYFLGSGFVVQYQVAIKLFGMLSFGLSIFIMPFWSSVTKAFQKGEFDWIKKSLKNLGYLLGFLFLCGVLLLSVSNFIYEIWLANTIKISFSLSVLCFIYICINCIGTVSNTIINASGKLTVLVYASIVSLIINIPLTFLFVKYFDLGLNGIVLANIISFVLFVGVSVIQCEKLVNQKASKIWNQ